MPKKKAEQTGEEKLDEILLHLRRMDRRDRLRTWGGFFKGVIGILPVLAFIYGAWYMYEHGDEVLAQIAKEAAQQAAAVTQGTAENLMEQIDPTDPGLMQKLQELQQNFLVR